MVNKKLYLKLVYIKHINLRDGQGICRAMILLKHDGQFFTTGTLSTCFVSIAFHSTGNMHNYNTIYNGTFFFCWRLPAVQPDIGTQHTKYSCMDWP